MTEATHAILLVEADPDIRRGLRELLKSERFGCIEAESAAAAEMHLRIRKPDLLLVDLDLPDADRLAFDRGVRRSSPVPTIVLSTLTTVEQKIAALDSGADDYVSKPFSADELVARMRAVLRRSVRGPERGDVLRVGRVRLELARRRAYDGHGEIHLTALEYRVLESLARHSGFVVSHERLVEEVWGPTHLGDTQSLRVCIKNLRRKLEPRPRRPRYVVTELGLGYRLLARPRAR